VAENIALPPALDWQSDAARKERVISHRLAVPEFPRLADYVGLWAIYPPHFLAYWHAATSTDLAAHVRAALPKPPEPKPTEMVPSKGGRSVAVVRVERTLMKQRPSLGGTSTVDVRRSVRSAANDPNVSGILLAIDSPGGTVAGTDDLAREVKAARRKKPTWAFVEDLGASAAYWVASQAGAIYANSPTALVGSIGTVMTVYDESKAAESQGVRPLVFATGPLKGAGEPGTAITEEQSAYLQGIVNQTQAVFDGAVRSGRNLSAAELGAVRSGGVFLASEAQRLRLIDGIKSFDATLDALAAAG
jgi:signal peptide peptidase SppA